MTPPSAAAVRASVERGDPLSLRALLAMQPSDYATFPDGSVYVAPNAARAHEAVTDAPERIAADPTASDTDTHRENSAAMEHARQDRLRRWQVER